MRPSLVRPRCLISVRPRRRCVYSCLVAYDTLASSDEKRADARNRLIGEEDKKGNFIYHHFFGRLRPRISNIRWTGKWFTFRLIFLASFVVVWRAVLPMPLLAHPSFLTLPFISSYRLHCPHPPSSSQGAAKSKGSSFTESYSLSGLSSSVSERSRLSLTPLRTWISVYALILILAFCLLGFSGSFSSSDRPGCPSLL